MEDQGDWELVKPELSFAIWKLWRSTDYKMTLWEGGILSWPDWFVYDATIYGWLNRMVRRDMGMEK